MARVQKTIDVDVPVRTAYNQWTQFEEFPQFMEGVHEVTQMGEKRLHWKAKVGGKEEEWDAEIREQIPDQKIIWHNTSGAMNAGIVTFDELGANQTRVHLEMSYDPEGFMEQVGDKLGFVSRRVEGDLQRFKEFVESRGVETGAWRGEIHNPDVPGGHTRGEAEMGRGPSDQATHGAGSSAAGIRGAAGSGEGYSGQADGGVGNRGLAGGYSGTTSGTTSGGPGMTESGSSMSGRGSSVGDTSLGDSRGGSSLNEGSSLGSGGTSAPYPYPSSNEGAASLHSGDVGGEGSQGYGLGGGSVSRGAGMDSDPRRTEIERSDMEIDETVDQDRGSADAGRRDMH